MFRDKGFDANLLINDAATYEEIIGSLQELVLSSRPGDVVVFQFSGHGVQLPEINPNGNDSGTDEAFVPFDYQNGAFLLDNDLNKIWSIIPDGVNVTGFLDSCHSGDMGRDLFLLNVAAMAVARDSGVQERVREITADEVIVSAHREFRSSNTRLSSSVNVRGFLRKNAVLFEACRDIEKAYERNGQGDFTQRALQVLRGRTGMTNDDFLSLVRQQFGPTPRQTPQIDCDDSAKPLLLLEPVFNLPDGQNSGGSRVDVTTPLDSTVTPVVTTQRAAVAQILRATASLLEQ